jgi:hypothetical protein
MGARASAQATRDTLAAQTATEAINARSAASSLSAQADLDVVNAKADFNAASAQASFDTISAQDTALVLHNNAEINAGKARTTAEGLTVSAAISDRAAQFSELQAQSALLMGQHDEQAQRLQTAQVKSKQTASLAARGVDLGEGSALNVLTSTDLVGENAVMAIQQKAMVQAFGYRTQGMNQQTDAAMKRGQAASVLANAELESSLTTARADAIIANANANADAKKALASAGLINAEAAAEMKRINARNDQANADAAGNVKKTMISSINPNAAMTNSLLTSVGQVAAGWYRYNKEAADTVINPNNYQRGTRGFSGNYLEYDA